MTSASGLSLCDLKCRAFTVSVATFFKYSRHFAKTSKAGHFFPFLASTSVSSLRS